MWGSGCIFPLFININFGFKFQLFTPHDGRLIPQGVIPDNPVIGGMEGHISHLDALETWRIFVIGRESNRAIQSAGYMKYAPSSRTQHQSCM
jgi:hypothetical protein